MYRIPAGTQRLRQRGHAVPLIALLVMTASITSRGLAQTAGNLPESDDSTIGYPSVEAALAALRANPGVTFSTENGWLIAKDEQGLAVWSFAPNSHPAYPTAVRRSVSERDGIAYVDMGVLCEADKVSCDNVVLQFQQINEALAQPAETVDVTRTGDGEFVLTLRASSMLTVVEAQAALLQAALKACEGFMPHYGKYTFEATESLEPVDDAEQNTFVFMQELNCTGTAPETSTPQSRNISDSEKEEISSVARNLTDAYFANLDNERYDEAYTMLSDEMRSTSSREAWIERAQSFSMQAGARVGGGAFGVSVYVDPPSAPAPGIYVAVDYEIKYERVPFRCGYIVWFQNENGGIEAVREEMGFIDDETVAEFDAEQLLELRRLFRCVAP